jgi:hypothetical protein
MRFQDTPVFSVEFDGGLLAPLVLAGMVPDGRNGAFFPIGERAFWC